MILCVQPPATPLHSWTDKPSHTSRSGFPVPAPTPARRGCRGLAQTFNFRSAVVGFRAGVKGAAGWRVAHVSCCPGCMRLGCPWCVKRVAHTRSVGLRVWGAAAALLRRDWLPPPSSAGLPHTDNPGAELPNSKAEAELPQSNPPKQQSGSRTSALQRLSVRAARFVPRPLHSLAKNARPRKAAALVAA